MWRPSKKDKRRLSGRRVRLRLLRRFRWLLRRLGKRSLRCGRLRRARLLRSRCRWTGMWRIFLVVGVVVVEMYFWIFQHQSSFWMKIPTESLLVDCHRSVSLSRLLFLFPLSLYFISCDGLVYHIKSPLFCLLYAHTSPSHSLILPVPFRSHFSFIFFKSWIQWE